MVFQPSLSISFLFVVFCFGFCLWVLLQQCLSISLIIRLEENSIVISFLWHQYQGILVTVTFSVGSFETVTVASLLAVSRERGGRIYHFQNFCLAEPDRGPLTQMLRSMSRGWSPFMEVLSNLAVFSQSRSSPNKSIYSLASICSHSAFWSDEFCVLNIHFLNITSSTRSKITLKIQQSNWLYQHFREP